METFDPNFADFLRLLNSRQVKYLVIGGYAVALHGFVRATGDLDIFVEVSDVNATKLVSVFRDFGFLGEDINLALFLEFGKIVRIGVPPLRVEIINRISGVTFAECYDRRVIADIDGMSVNFIDRQSLLTNKRAARRAKDLADVDELTKGESD